MQILRVNNSKILTMKSPKFSGYYFYMHLNIWGDFQICISVPLKNTFLTEYLRWLILNMGLKLWGHPFSKLNLQMIAKAGSNENPIAIPSTYV